MTTIEQLSELKLIAGSKVIDAFETHFNDILEIKYESESQLINRLWQRYQAGHTENNTNGKVFECLLAILLYRSGIQPIFVQAKLAFVPNVEFDFVLYTKEVGPIVLSAKTSLRERYKQADLEGMMLRQVHRKAKSYLITLSENEAKAQKKKIKTGEILGIDDIIVATESTFDDLLKELKTYTFYQPAPIEVISNVQRVISSNN